MNEVGLKKVSKEKVTFSAYYKNHQIMDFHEA